jgi:hypothetical protein
VLGRSWNPFAEFQSLDEVALIFSSFAARPAMRIDSEFRVDLGYHGQSVPYVQAGTLLRIKSH